MYQVRHAPNLFVWGVALQLQSFKTAVRRHDPCPPRGPPVVPVQSIPKAPRSPAHYDLSTLPRALRVKPGNVYTGEVECFVVGARSRQSRFGAHRHISVIGFLACYIVW